MATIDSVYKRRIEDYLQMNGGYVLDFSNSSFASFVYEKVGKNIDDEKYSQYGNSKAKRLREFIRIENSSTVGRLLEALVKYRKEVLDIGKTYDQDSENQYQICLKIIANLKSDTNDIDWTHSSTEDLNLDQLSNIIQELITRGDFVTGIDRLHTFTVKLIRRLCQEKGIDTNNKPLQSIYGEYVRYLSENNWIESTMTNRILKTSISILDAFNDVRNNQSLAHDNELLNYDECLLIFKNVSATINFIKAIEEKNKKVKTSTNDVDWLSEDLPF